MIYRVTYQVIHQVIYQVDLFKRQSWKKTVLIYALIVSLSSLLSLFLFFYHIQATAIICGQSTCGVRRPCNCCLTKKDVTTVSMWLPHYGFDTNKCHEVGMRVGENSREKFWKRFVSLAGKGRQRISGNKKCRSDSR